MVKKLLVVNPNTNPVNTETIAKSAAAATIPFDSYVQSDTVQCFDSLSSNEENGYNAELSTYWTLEKIASLILRYDAILVACFSNHGSVEALREVSTKPVMHVMEASILQAATLGERFSIITTNEEWREIQENDIQCMGLHQSCASVRPIGITSLETSHWEQNDLINRIIEQGRLAVEEDNADVIILGCTGFSGLQDIVSIELKVPVIDPVISGVTALANELITQNIPMEE